MNWPKHMSLSISHNQHKDYYQKIEDYFSNYPHLEDVDKDEKKACIEADEIWEIQWYPRTPISFYYVAASTFEKALALAMEIDKEQ